MEIPYKKLKSLRERILDNEATIIDWQRVYKLKDHIYITEINDEIEAIIKDNNKVLILKNNNLIIKEIICKYY